jgi:hypothetical protein
LAAGHVGHEARGSRGGLEEFPGGAGFLQVGGLGGVPAGAESLRRACQRAVSVKSGSSGEGQQFEQAGIARTMSMISSDLRDVEQASLACVGLKPVSQRTAS